jgi:pyridoxal phosphate enzyme (YggS family)
MSICKKYFEVHNIIKNYSLNTTLIIVTKNQDLQKINLLISKEHLNFGENKVQEAIFKWTNLLLNNPKLKLHLIGKLQSNKAKEAFKIFHYVHTLDNEKLAKIFSKLEENSSKKITYFVQVNIANEPQKNGISVNELNPFIKYCVNDLKLNIVGLMCIPPVVDDPTNHFKALAELAKLNHLNELSMGMSNDYEIAIKNGATFVRVGSKIFSES